MKILEVEKKYDGKKLNTFLLEHFDGLALNVLYKALRKKDIRINDKRISKNCTIYTGDKIKIFITDDYLFSSKLLDIVYEDSQILVVNKPIDLEVTGNASLTNKLSEQLQQNVFPCHRLDRNTIGLVLFAKTEEALAILLDKFKKREIEKHYRCLVYGIPAPLSAELNAFLFKDKVQSCVYIADEYKKGYVKIHTSYQTLTSNSTTNTSLLDVTLHTGRTHQIRAHLAHIGYPIIGDGKYGRNEINKQFFYSKQCLCSYSLKFNFITDSGCLTYLTGKEIILPKGTELFGRH